MQIQSVDDVWARIAGAASAAPGGVVATDADGTLWDGDVGEDLFHAFIEHGEVRDPALEAMRRQARDHGLSDAGTGPDIARRLYAGYVDGSFPEKAACELMAWCFAGWTRDAVADFACGAVEKIGLTARMHDEVMGLLERARKAGVEVILVSASPEAVVVAAGARAGFDARQVVAARPRYERDVMLPAIEAPIPYAGGKVQRLRERIGPKRTLYAALGDNGFDVALLAAAHVGIAVRPKPRLRERASEVPGLVELAPATRAT